MDDIHNDSSKFKTLILLDKFQTVIEKVIVSIGLILATLIIFINILNNLFTGSTIPWASEIAQYIIIWVIFIGASLLIRKKEHVKVDLLMRFLSKKAELYLELLIYLVVCAFLFYLTYLGIMMTLDVYKTGQSMITIKLSMAWAYLGYPVGLFLMTINSLKVLILQIRKAMEYAGREID